MAKRETTTGKASPKKLHRHHGALERRRRARRLKLTYAMGLLRRYDIADAATYRAAKQLVLASIEGFTADDLARNVEGVYDVVQRALLEQLHLMPATAETELSVAVNKLNLSFSEISDRVERLNQKLEAYLSEPLRCAQDV